MVTMNLKKLTAVIMSGVICLSALCACGNKAPEGETTVPENSGVTLSTESAENHQLCLPYSKADSVNPFKAESALNQHLSTLLYDGLYKLDETLKATPWIASNGTVSGRDVLVTLRSDAKFRDGSAVTASDVAASFQKAKTSPQYSAQLQNFQSCRVQKNNSLLFTMTSENPNALSLLDFAIVKGSTADSDFPTGSGRYYVVKKGTDVSLKSNKNWRGTQDMSLENITLNNISDSSALSHSMEIGNIDYFFTDLNSGSYQRINGATQEFTLNNFVYLGVQHKNSILANPLVLQAIGKALDRNAVVTNAYQGHAVETTVPFRPDWNALSSIKVPQNTLDNAAAIKLLQDAGFTKELTGGTRSNGSQNLTFKLIVNKENGFRAAAARLIAQQLGKIGMSVSVNVLSFEEYTKALQDGNFDLYIGEVKLLNDMNLSSFFNEDGAARFGIQLDGESAAAYKEYLVSPSSLQKFVDSFSNQPAFFPICFRKGVSASSRAMKTEVKSHANDLFANINEWKF